MTCTLTLNLVKTDSIFTLICFSFPALSGTYSDQKHQIMWE